MSIYAIKNYIERFSNGVIAEDDKLIVIKETETWKFLTEELVKVEKDLDALSIIRDCIAFNEPFPSIMPSPRFGSGEDINLFIEGVTITILKQIEGKKRMLLRNWVLENCFPEELRNRIENYEN